MFESIKEIKNFNLSWDRILKKYSIAFSSGTSEKLKKINLSFDEPAKEKKRNALLVKLKNIKLYINYKRSFWY